MKLNLRFLACVGAVLAFSITAIAPQIFAQDLSLSLPDSILAPASPVQPPAQQMQQPQAFSVDAPFPSLFVSTQGPQTMVVGKQSSYGVTVKNGGNVDARDVVVTVTMPSKVDIRRTEPATGTTENVTEEDQPYQIVWSIPAIPAGTTTNMAVAVIPRSGKPFDMNVSLSIKPVSASTHVTVLEPKVAVKFLGPNDMVFGDETTVVAQVSNPGTGVAENVTLDMSASAASDNTQRIGDIPPGETRTLEYKIPTASAGKQNMQAIVRADLGLEAEQVHEYMVRRSKLVVDVYGPQFEYASSPVNYKVSVNNTGDADAKDVGVNIYLPQGIVYSGEMPGVTKTKNGVLWTVDAIKAGGERELTMPCILSMPGEQRVQVVATEQKQEVKGSGELATMVRAVADLKLTVHDAPGPRPLGSETVYEIRVVNRGTKEARQISVTARCGDKLKLTDVSGNASVERDVIKFQAIDVLPAGKTAIFRVTARGMAVGAQPISVSLNCRNPDTQLVAQETTQFYDQANKAGRKSTTAKTKPLPTSSRSAKAPTVPRLTIPPRR